MLESYISSGAIKGSKVMADKRGKAIERLSHENAHLRQEIKELKKEEEKLKQEIHGLRRDYSKKVK